MAIVFFCQSCGARFDVPPQSAGKKGRCRKCGQMMQVPRAEQLASMAAMPAVATPSPAHPVAPRRPAPTTAQSLSWLRAAASSVGLAPLTVSHLPIGARNGRAASVFDDADDSKPYLFASPDPYKGQGAARGAANVAMGAWNRQMGGVQRLFRWLNESAYFVSIPFLILFLFGVATKSRGLALFAAAIVVLLNLGRIVAGVANLLVIPLRSGMSGRKLKRPVRRVVEPILTIGAIYLAFTFVPWLAPEGSSGRSVAERLRGGVEPLVGEMKDEVKSTVEQARNVDLQKLGAEARERMRTVGTGEGGAPAAPAGPPSGPSGDAVNKLIKNVGERVRSTIDEAQGRP